MFRALQLGDMLCAVPALRALRAGYPAAEIVLVGLPWARSFAARFRRYIDDFVEFPGHPLLPERAADRTAWPAFIVTLRDWRFDLALQLHGDGAVVNELVSAFNAASTAGFCPAAAPNPDPARFIPYRDRGPEVRRLLRLASFVGGDGRDDSLEFPLYGCDHRAFSLIADRYALRPGSYVCVHAGARAGARRWPAGNFAYVADAMHARGMTVVLTGTEAERGCASIVAQTARAPVVDLVGKTSLGALAVLLSGARLLICNDTGVSHLAAAVKAPSVVVFTGSDRLRWAPANRALHRALTWPSRRQAVEVSLAVLDGNRAHAA